MVRTAYNKRVSGFGLRLRPNAFAKFITMQSFSNAMSEGTSDTRKPLSEISSGAMIKINVEKHIFLSRRRWNSCEYLENIR